MPIGTPARPGNAKGQRRLSSIEPRMLQMKTTWRMVLQATMRSVVCTGSSTCSQSALVASAKAKPAVPTDSAPRNAPSQTKPNISQVMPATTRSAGVEQEDEPDRDCGCGTAGQHGERALVDVEELDREHAQAQAHVNRQYHDQGALGELHERVAGRSQEAVERVRAMERGRERQKVQRQEDRERNPGQAVEQRRHKAGLLVRGAHHAT